MISATSVANVNRELLRSTTSRVCRNIDDERAAIARTVLRGDGDDARTTAIDAYQTDSESEAVSVSGD